MHSCGQFATNEGGKLKCQVQPFIVRLAMNVGFLILSLSRSFEETSKVVRELWNGNPWD